LVTSISSWFWVFGWSSVFEIVMIGSPTGSTSSGSSGGSSPESIAISFSNSLRSSNELSHGKVNLSLNLLKLFFFVIVSFSCWLFTKF
jgi:hypothetical protein